jgi:hypothetical protein
MKANIVATVGLCTLLSAWSISSAEQQKILGTYQSNLTVYSKDGKKEKIITNVTDDVIEKSTVLQATTPRGLILVNFQGDDIWLRASQLKLSAPADLNQCPESLPPGKTTDRMLPVASGMGPNCE